MRILFLSLDTFSRTGGIQQFNRCMQLAITRWIAGHSGKLTHISLLDKPADVLPQYCEADVLTDFTFLGCSGKKIAFTRCALQAMKTHDLVIFGHVNLVSLLVFATLKPTQSWLVAHGIEVWSPLSFLKKKGLNRVKKVLAVSHYTGEMLMQNQGISKEKWIHFPNALDPFLQELPVLPASDWNHAWRLDTEKTYLLTLARLSATEQEKGYDEVIRLLPELKRQFPNIRYLLAGKSDEAEYERIRKLADSLGVSHLVLMPGYVKTEWLPALYNLAAAFVMPSRKEGFGLVYLEAAWWGCPVIAYHAGGASEALMDGALGTLVSPPAPEFLLQAILQIIGTAKKQPLQQNRITIQSCFGFGMLESRLKNLLPDSEIKGIF